MENKLQISGENLKEKLDNIDKQVSAFYGSKYGEAMEGVYIGQWHKGREITGMMGEGGSYRQLERDTNRNHGDLKKWHDLYKTYPDIEIFKHDYVKTKVEEAMFKWLEGQKKLYSPNPILEFPEGKYQVIYADPPWDVKAGPGWSSGEASRDLKYPTLSVKEIEEMPVESITGEDAHLYLWTINKYIEDAYKIARKWGFEPTCLLTWCKPPHGIGLGGTFVQTTEYLLFCRKGTLTSNKRIDTTWWEYKRGKHSVKPEEFRRMIEEVSPGKRIELFARERSEGWDVWGNEV